MTTKVNFGHLLSMTDNEVDISAKSGNPRLFCLLQIVGVCVCELNKII